MNASPSKESTIGRRGSVESVAETQIKRKVSMKPDIEIINKMRSQKTETIPLTLNKKKPRKSHSFVTAPRKLINSRLSRRNSMLATSNPTRGSDFERQVLETRKIWNNRAASSISFLQRRSIELEDTEKLRHTYMPLLKASLQKVFMVRHMDKAILSDIANAMTCVTVRNGESLHEVDTMITHMSIVIEGTLELVETFEDGSKKTKVLTSGDVFGEDALVCETSINYRVYCVEENTVVWSIAGSEFRKLRERRSRQDIEFALTALQKHKLFYVLPIRTITSVVESFTNRTSICCCFNLSCAFMFHASRIMHDET